MTAPLQAGYAPANGLSLYYEIHGAGAPLVLLHGGLGMTGMFGALLPQLARSRQVIAVDLQGHGRTADIERPLRFELMADDIAALLAHLGCATADFMGYSLGGGVALRAAIQHPARVRKLVLISTPCRRDDWYPAARAGMDQMGAAAFEFMQTTPLYASYVDVAPAPDQFPRLLDKTGDLLRQEYDWSEQVAAMQVPALLVFGDADSIPPDRAAAFFALLGGGQAEGSWDGSGMVASQLAILPGTTHYAICDHPLLPSIVTAFLDAPSGSASRTS